MGRKVEEPYVPAKMGTQQLGAEQGRRMDVFLQQVRASVNSNAAVVPTKKTLQTNGTGPTEIYLSGELPLASTRATYVVATVAGSSQAVFSVINRVFYHARTTGAPFSLGTATIHSDVENYPSDEPSLSVAVSGNSISLLVDDGGSYGLPADWAVWVTELEHTP